jgi:hypothetical protein
VTSYLFFWNPSQDPESFCDYDQVRSDAQTGKVYKTRWKCPSKKPLPGEIAFMQRTGNKGNGIFARGVVVSKVYDDENGVRVVDLQLDSFLPLELTIPRDTVVAQAEYHDSWQRQSSGTVIPPDLVNALELLWHSNSNSPVANDIEVPAERIESFVSRIVRDTAATIALKFKYDFKCQICDITLPYGKDQQYIEVHHLRPLGHPHDGPDVESNMLVLCPNHHTLFDFGVPRFISDSSLEINGTTFNLAIKHKIASSNITYYIHRLCRPRA